MRLVVLGIGLVLAAAGAVVWLVPLEPEQASIQIPVGDAYDFGVPSTLEFGSIPYQVSWTSGPAAQVLIFSCGSNSACPAGTNGSLISNQNGSSGHVGWESRAGLYYLLVPNQTTNVTVDYKSPVDSGLVGLSVLGVGLVVMLAGLAVPGRKPPVASPPPAATTPPEPEKAGPWTEDPPTPP